jgi:flagellar protein FlbD
MIRVKKINGEEVVINAELIETVEARPDTTISLSTGNKIIVKDTVSEVIEKVIEYRRSVKQKRTEVK